MSTTETSEEAMKSSTTTTTYHGTAQRSGVGNDAANTASDTIRQVNLRHLVNLALSSSPKAGVVNFNLLKVFLLELLKALNLQNHELKFDPNTIDSSLTAGLLDGEITQSALDAANQSLLVILGSRLELYLKLINLLFIRRHFW